VNAIFSTPDGTLRPVWRFLISAIATFIVIFYVPGFIYSIGIPQPFTWALDRIITALLLFGIYVWMLRVLDHSRSPAADLGLGKPRARTTFIFGALFGAGLVTVAVIAIALLGGYRAEVSVAGSAGALVIVVTITLLAGAITEELAFRGYPFQRLVEALGPVGAILVLSALFGAIHAYNPSVSRVGLVNTLLIGVLFSIAFLETRSLWLVWGMHFGWNFMLGVVAGLPVSGLKDFSVIVHGHAQGPVWLTGGEYGIEGSLNATFVILLGTAVVIPMLRRMSRTTAGTDGSIQSVQGCISKPEGE
jgi:membrane protease YdiL (CAAX protease family)